MQGKNAGFDVEIAKWFARYAFGREQRVSFVCAPTPSREPLLTTGRVDLVISTFTYTADRDTRIDFSRAYYKADGTPARQERRPGAVAGRHQGQEGRDDERLDLRPLDEALLSRTPQVIVTDSFTNALLAFNQGRADALMWDDTVLVRRRGRRPDGEAHRRRLPRRRRTGSGSSRGTSR